MFAIYCELMAPDSGEITILLRRAALDSAARDQLFQLVYPKLRRLASAYLAKERQGHTLQPTALVNEAFLRMPNAGIDWQGRSHFFAVAATVMRRVLVDHARAVLTEKRGSGKKVELTDTLVYDVEQPEHLVELDSAMHRLTEMQPRQSQVVEMRFFAGMTETEIAHVLNVSARTVKRDWRVARAWLFAELTGKSRERPRK